MIPEYGVCPTCRRGRALCTDRTLRSHRLLVAAGYSVGRCKGAGEPALALLPGKPDNRLTVYLRPEDVMDLPETPTPNLLPDPAMQAAMETAADQAATAVRKLATDLLPVVQAFVEGLVPVFVQMNETLGRMAKDLEKIGQAVATANRQQRMR